MRNIKDKIKKYLLIRHTEAKLKECNERIEKNIPWIQRKSLANTIEAHCRVLLNELINAENDEIINNSSSSIPP